MKKLCGAGILLIMIGIAVVVCAAVMGADVSQIKDGLFIPFAA